MNPRVAPLVRVVGGLSLALLCVQIGWQQQAGERAEAPPPTLEDLVKLPEPAPPSPEPVRAALAPLPRFTVPSVYPMDASCGAGCGVVAAATGLFWDNADLPTLHVSAPFQDDAAARGADIPIAFAFAAAQGAAQMAAPPAADAAPPQPSWPTPPPLAPAPGSRGVEPVVAALFEPDLTPPTDTEVAPSPQGEDTTPMARPLDAHPTPEGLDPSASAEPLASVGAPFKRSGQPGDKASGRAPAPLAQGPVFHPYAPARVPQGPSGAPGSDAPWQQVPGQGPEHSPGQPADFPGQPGYFPGQVPEDLPSPPPDWLSPNQGPGGQAPTQPLLEDPSVPDRVARGEPSDPLLSPRFDPVALPSDLVAAALVSEPGALALLAIAALGLATARRPRRC